MSEATAEQTWLMIDPKQPATQGLLGQPIDKQAYSRRGYMDFCVQKWGYVLGPGNAVNESSAEAVIGACAEPLKELDLAEGQEDEARTHAHTFAWPHSSEATGQTVSIEQQNYEHYLRQAYFFLAQSHAGHCPVPS